MSPEKSKVRCRAPLLRTRGGPGRPSASLPCRSALSPGVAVGTLEGRAPPWSGGGGGPLTKGTRAQLPELLPGLLLRMSPAPLSPVPKTHTLRRRRPRQPPAAERHRKAAARGARPPRPGQEGSPSSLRSQEPRHRGASLPRAWPRGPGQRVSMCSRPGHRPPVTEKTPL